ncbi:hypothetical protein BY996DRAFT_6422203 [Phakopsora pachyrhizi]|nr:hypothetical protein BY996DRAFT_6422203 [Phakopsora pachyrhizi]
MSQDENDETEVESIESWLYEETDNSDVDYDVSGEYDEVQHLSPTTGNSSNIPNTHFALEDIHHSSQSSVVKSTKSNWQDHVRNKSAKLKPMSHRPKSSQAYHTDCKNVRSSQKQAEIIQPERSKFNCRGYQRGESIKMQPENPRSEESSANHQDYKQAREIKRQAEKSRA